MAKPITIKVTGDDSGFKRTMRGVNGSLGGLERNVGKMVARVGALLAGIGIAKVGLDSIRMASDIEEAMSKVGVVFGELSNGVIADSQAAARALGINQANYLTYTSNIGAALGAAGATAKEVSDLSTGAVKTFADMASFHNAEVADVSLAWESAMRGSFEPIQKFMPFITNEFLLNYAKINGIIDDSVTKLDVHTRAITLQAIAMDEELNPALDDFAETQGGAANQGRILSAQFDNLKGRIGSALLPAVTALAVYFNDELLPALADAWDWLKEKLTPVFGFLKDMVKDHVIPALERFWEWVGPKLVQAAEWGKEKVILLVEAIEDIVVWLWDKGVIKALGEFIAAVGEAIPDAIELGVAAIESLVGWFKEHDEALGALTAAMVAFGIFMATKFVIQMAIATAAVLTQVTANISLLATWIAINAPIILIIAAIALLAAGFIWAYQNVDWFRASVDAVVKFILGTFWPKLKEVAAWLSDNFVTILEVVGRVIAATLTGGMSEAVIWMIKHRDSIKDLATGMIEWFKDLPSKMTGAVAGLWDGLKSGLVDTLNWIIGKYNTLASKIPGVGEIGLIGSGRRAQKSFYALGTASFAGGQAMVGERGPELVTLPKGSRIEPNHGAGMSAAAGNITVNVATNADPFEIGREIAWKLSMGGV